MSNYVLAFHGQPTRTPPADFDAQWGTWFASLGSSIVDMGNRVSSLRTLPGQGAEQAPSGGLTGYVVVSAADADEAARHALGCPGLAYGISVEIAEVVPA